MLTRDDFMIRLSTSRYMPTETTITATMLIIIEAQYGRPISFSRE